MKEGKVRTIHRRLGISIACFLLVQVIAGMLMSIGRLASVDTSKPYTVLYSIHADWDPLGSIYRAILGLATAGQGVLGIMIFLDRRRKTESPFRLSSQPDALEKENPIRALSFSADIRPLFRPRDIEFMKPFGIDLSSYEDVKKHAPHMYARLSAKEMPCDEPWNDSQMLKFKEWMQSRMER